MSSDKQGRVSAMTIRLPAELHRVLRIVAAGEGTSMNDIVVDLLRSQAFTERAAAVYGRLQEDLRQ